MQYETLQPMSTFWSGECRQGIGSKTKPTDLLMISGRHRTQYEAFNNGATELSSVSTILSNPYCLTTWGHLKKGNS